MNKTIMILDNSSSGLYRLRFELIEKLALEEMDIILNIPDEKYKKNFDEIGCSLIKTPIDRRGMSLLKDLKLFLSYKQAISQMHPDVVLLYTVKPNVYGGLACRLTRTPYISTITGLGTALENPGVLQKLVIFLYQIGLRKVTALMFQNKAEKEFFASRRIGKNYHLVAGSGVNLEKYRFAEYPAKDSEIRFLFVARIMKDKGIFEFLSAAREIKNRWVRVQFDIVGSYDEKLQSVVEQEVKEGNVNYFGQQSNMHEFYRNCWAVIMPSYHEGLCNVCLEGAATGRPIIATNVPGCKETFDEGVSGIGFEPRSSKALVEALEKFLALSYERKVKMGIAGRKKIEREFDRKDVVDVYAKEINKVIGD